MLTLSPSQKKTKNKKQRKRAWDCCPYPCIGHWVFLKLQLRKHAEFEEVVRRTQQGQKFLDVGCAIGQDLRSLVSAPFFFVCVYLPKLDKP